MITVSDEIINQAIALRHRLHSYPELAFKEFVTTETLYTELSKISGVKVKRFSDLTGVVVDIESNNNATEYVALRADIDALPIKEQGALPYISKNRGVMHACGHDGHSACLFGAIKVLATLKDKLSFNVRCIFQPAEEGEGGAVELIKRGVLDCVTQIYGLHGWPTEELGAVCITSGAAMGANNKLSVTVTGKGSHACSPHLGADPVVVAGHLIVGIQTLVSRFQDPLDSVVISICMVNCGTARNIIPDNVSIEGTIRTLNETTRERVILEVTNFLEGMARSFGVEIKYDLAGGYPVLINTNNECLKVANAAKNIGLKNIKLGFPPTLAAEDFAYYLQKVPGTFWFLGLTEKGKELPMLHTANFDFPDVAIPFGIAMHIAIIQSLITEVL
jgi:amidohydrolase